MHGRVLSSMVCLQRPIVTTSVFRLQTVANQRTVNRKRALGKRSSDVILKIFLFLDFLLLVIRNVLRNCKKCWNVSLNRLRERNDELVD